MVYFQLKIVFTFKVFAKSITVIVVGKEDLAFNNQNFIFVLVNERFESYYCDS